jgi:hypothetical protein
MSKLLVVNLFAGPGAGKSTIAANVFAELKWAGVNCELVTEYAKDKVWEGSEKVLDNQVYVFGKQVQRLHRLVGKVDVAITDSPIILSMYYNRLGKSWKKLDGLVVEAFHQFDNLNYFLVRKKAYQQAGRLQTEEEAKGIDVEVKNILGNEGFAFTEVPGTRNTVWKICADVGQELVKRGGTSLGVDMRV